MERCRLFHTHHAPTGAWASLTFGAPGTGVSIDVQEPNVKRSGSLLIGEAVPGEIRTLGFADQPKEELTAEGDEEKKKQYRNPLEAFHLYREEDITRFLTPSRDIFQAGNVTVTVHTPYDALPDPKKQDIPPLACVPGILLEVTVDNTRRKVPCTVFFGLLYHDMKQMYAMEQEGMCTIGYRNQWMFAADEAEGAYLVRGMDAVQSLMEGRKMVHQNGPGFLCLRAEAGTRKTLRIAFSVYAKEGSNGARKTEYYYNRYFRNAGQAAKYILAHAEDLEHQSRKVEEEIGERSEDPLRFQLFCQAVRAYYASTQLLVDESGDVRYNVCEGAYLWRNTMDLCADHLVWELKRNPWVVRCIMDEFIRDYSYYDRVRFPNREGLYEGGISFTHDMGCYFTYTPPGSSGYERENDSRKGFYFYMTTEELLNGIYGMAGYGLKTRDVEWMKKQGNIFRDSMTSLENRDDCVPERRNGVLKAVSEKSGRCMLESTTYDALDHSLLEASGNLYVFIKTWCALILLKRCFLLCGDEASAMRAENMLKKCRRSIKLFQKADSPILKANVYQDIEGAVIAAAEAMAVPHMLHVLSEAEEPELFEAMRAHTNACLQPGVCIDPASGGLRLSSTSKNTWPSKSVLTIYVMEEVLGLAVPKEVVREVIGWAQVSAKETTIADQIMSDTKTVVGAVYYPRIVTAALWAGFKQ